MIKLFLQIPTSAAALSPAMVYIVTGSCADSTLRWRVGGQAAVKLELWQRVGERGGEQSRVRVTFKKRQHVTRTPGCMQGTWPFWRAQTGLGCPSAY